MGAKLADASIYRDGETAVIADFAEPQACGWDWAPRISGLLGCA
jgi:hypothetical protein